MSETLSKMWLELSICFVGATWTYVLAVLKSRGPGFSWWDQWANFGYFLKLIRTEETIALRRRYAGVLAVHVAAEISAFCAFVLFVRSQIT
jgi:hypothetical protein